ncbi:MAG: hypothetical protein OXC12_15365, partial [Spirochaetaceae bacterium]|nr:hypothetical protein [Spirochaetaceae bacterium]
MGITEVWVWTRSSAYAVGAWERAGHGAQSSLDFVCRGEFLLDQADHLSRGRHRPTLAPGGQ